MNKWIIGLVFSLMLGSAAFAGTVRGDFNGDGTVDMSDIACWYGYFQRLKQTATPDLQSVIDQAQVVRKSISDTFATKLPDKTLMDLDSTAGQFDMNDIALAYGWYQYIKQNPNQMDANNIKTLAQVVRKSLASTLEKFPGLEIGSSTTNISIDGIQPN